MYSLVPLFSDRLLKFYLHGQNGVKNWQKCSILAKAFCHAMGASSPVFALSDCL